MELAYPSSTNIAMIGWQSGAHLTLGLGLSPNGALYTHAMVDNPSLYVHFKRGGSYRYDGVPYVVFDSLKKAESPGRFFINFIKEKYPTTKLERDLAEVVEAA